MKDTSKNIYLIEYPEFLDSGFSPIIQSLRGTLVVGYLTIDGQAKLAKREAEVARKLADFEKEKEAVRLDNSSNCLARSASCDFQTVPVMPVIAVPGR